MNCGGGGSCGTCIVEVSYTKLLVYDICGAFRSIYSARLNISL
jgi:hypothetical protein